MDDAEFVERVRDAKATELDRLGSEKALVAETNAALDRGTVLERAAAAEMRAAETFDQWAASEENESARKAFADAAERERDHYEQVCELGDVEATDPEADALHGYLRELEGTAERVGAGLVARPLVASRTLLQVINFFINEADETTANTFRGLRSDTDDQVEAGATLLTEVCTDEEWDAAERAATEAIDRAYTEYADTLEAMGVDPKPVC